MLIRNILPILALALKSASNRQIAQDFLRVYLGRDAGARVLSEEIRRGSLREIRAVICYFDLTGLPVWPDRHPEYRDTNIPRRPKAWQGVHVSSSRSGALNDYFGVAVAAIQQSGGNVLKFMGDGMLTMFAQDDMADAAAAAMEAAAHLSAEIQSANQ